MLNYVIGQVGLIRAISLVVATLAMIAYAQYSAFRETRVKTDLDWKTKPVRSFLTFAGRQEVSYMKRVPWMIGAIVAMTTAAVFIPQ